MLTHYLSWHVKNFGDRLNDYIFQGLTPLLFRLPVMKNLPNGTALGLGTILNHKVLTKCTVLGTGTNGEDVPNINLDYSFVRGRLTAEKVKLSKKYAVGDTAFGVKGYFESLADTPLYPIGIIPHYRNLSMINDERVIDVTLPCAEFIRRVSQCKIILTEAMHGAILADCLRIPWAPVSIDKKNYPVPHFKWNDFASVLDMELEWGDLNSYKLHLSDQFLLEKVSREVNQRLKDSLPFSDQF